MTYFEWKNDYSVGIAIIDNQHKKWVQYLNNLYELTNAGKGKETLNIILVNMAQYTQYHFTSEENLLRMHKYPDYEEHRQKHEILTGQVQDFNLQFSAGHISSPMQIADFLKEWLTDHILDTDKKYAPFLKEKGVR